MYKIVLNDKETNLFTDCLPDVKGDYLIFKFEGKEVLKMNKLISDYTVKEGKMYIK